MSLEAQVSELAGRMSGQEEGWERERERAALIQGQVELKGIVAAKEEVIRKLMMKIETMERTIEGVVETDVVTCVRPDATSNEPQRPDAGPHDDPMNKEEEEGEEGEVAAAKNDLSDKVTVVHSSPTVGHMASPAHGAMHSSEQHAPASLSSPLLITLPSHLSTNMPLAANDASPLLQV